MIYFCMQQHHRKKADTTMDKNNLKDRLIQDRLINAKKTGRIAKASQMLSDDHLEKVTGGYMSTEGWSSNYNIVCPNCAAEKYNDFVTWIESDDDKMDGFQCQRCGCIFGVDAKGRYWGNI